MSDASPTRRIVIPVLAAVLTLVVGMFTGWQAAHREAVRADNAEVGEARAEAGQDAAKSGVDAATDYLTALCETGNRSACLQRAELDDLGNALDDLEAGSGTGEQQEPEVQEPEVQERERNDPDRDDPESQDPDADDVDPDDPESQDDEAQDDEIQDPEIDDPEVQDPEVDDPDPNSALTFAVADTCAPTEGTFVISVDLDVSRSDGTVTYALTCQTAPIPTIAPVTP